MCGARVRRGRHPAFRQDALAVPDAVLQVQVADLREVPRREVQPALGVGEALRRALPVEVDAERRKEVLLRVVVGLFARRLPDQVREKLRRAAVVDEDLAGILRHRLLEHVADPVLLALHHRAVVGGVRVLGRLLVPADPGRHRQDVAERHPIAARVGRDLEVREVRHRLDVDARDLAAADRDADERGGHALRDRLHRVEPRPLVVRVPARVVVVVDPGRALADEEPRGSPPTGRRSSRRRSSRCG